MHKHKMSKPQDFLRAELKDKKQAFRTASTSGLETLFRSIPGFFLVQAGDSAVDVNNRNSNSVDDDSPEAPGYKAAVWRMILYTITTSFLSLLPVMDE